MNEILELHADLNFKEHSRRRHYIFEQIDVEFIHFTAVCDIEVERWITVQWIDYDTPPFIDITDTIEVYNLKCIDKEDDTTVLCFTKGEVEYIEELIIDEIDNRLNEL